MNTNCKQGVPSLKTCVTQALLGFETFNLPPQNFKGGIVYSVFIAVMSCLLILYEKTIQILKRQIMV